MMKSFIKYTSVVFAFFLITNFYGIRDFADSLISSLYYLCYDSGIVFGIINSLSDILTTCSNILSWLVLYEREIYVITQIILWAGLIGSLGYIIYLAGLEPEYKSVFGTVGMSYNPEACLKAKKPLNEIRITGIDHTIPNSKRYRDPDTNELYRPYLDAHRHLIDRRYHGVKNFRDIRCKKPTYLRVLGVRKNTPYAFIIVKEVFWDAYCLITRLIAAEDMNESSLSRLMQRMSLTRDDYNLAPEEECEFTNSVRYAFDVYQQYYEFHELDDAQRNWFSTVLGFHFGKHGSFARRLLFRACDRHDEAAVLRCLKMAGVCAGGLGLTYCYGYVWKRIPPLYQKKSYAGPGLLARLAHVGDETVRKVAYSAINYFNPRPDIGNIDNLIDGREARLNVSVSNGVNIGQPTALALAELTGVVADDLGRWKPVTLGSTDEWLDTRKNYSLNKKNLIKRLLDNPPRNKQDSIFLKWESYDSFKAPRVISNSDKVEVATEGPVIVAAEEQFEQLPSILSGKPVNTWGEIVMNALKPYELSGEYNILVTDHSSFEGSISPAIKDAVENPIYDQLLLNYPELARHLRERQSNRRYVKFATRRDNGQTEFIAYNYSNRASGDARTYQANSLTNHYLIAGLQHHFNYSAPFFVSGDDGLMAVPKNITIPQVKQYFADLGFDTKLEATEIHRSGFCGFNFDPNNGNRRLCQDVISTILDFFTAPSKYGVHKYKNYLYDKAICMLHEYQADPTLRPALEYILSKKRRYIIRKYRTNWWDRFIMEQDNESIQDLLNQPVTDFEEASLIHHNNLTSAEEKKLATAFLHATQEIFENTSSRPGLELVNYIYGMDTIRREPRALFNNLNAVEGNDGIYTWNVDAYNNLFKY